MDSPTAVYELHVELIGLLDSIFEVWLGFTFATLVAMHFAAFRLNKFMLAAALSLYLLASLIFASRYLHAANVFSIMNQKLVQAGFDPYPTPDLPHTPLVFLLFVVGTLVTVFYSTHMHFKDA
jgi:hypothetical protein